MLLCRGMTENERGGLRPLHPRGGTKGGMKGGGGARRARRAAKAAVRRPPRVRSHRRDAAYDRELSAFGPVTCRRIHVAERSSLRGRPDERRAGHRVLGEPHDTPSDGRHVRSWGAWCAFGVRPLHGTCGAKVCAHGRAWRGAQHMTDVTRGEAFRASSSPSPPAHATASSAGRRRSGRSGTLWSAFPSSPRGKGRGQRRGSRFPPRLLPSFPSLPPRPIVPLLPSPPLLLSLPPFLFSTPQRLWESGWPVWRWSGGTRHSG